jgi:hypothetical protein
MPRPLELRDFLKRLRQADDSIVSYQHRGKGSHLLLSKETSKGRVSFPIPTTTGEVAGPYQKAVIRIFALPPDCFEKPGK